MKNSQCEKGLSEPCHLDFFRNHFIKKCDGLSDKNYKQYFIFSFKVCFIMITVDKSSTDNKIISFLHIFMYFFHLDFFRIQCWNCVYYSNWMRKKSKWKNVCLLTKILKTWMIWLLFHVIKSMFITFGKE
jgi:hypothetical protein